MMILISTHLAIIFDANVTVLGDIWTELGSAANCRSGLQSREREALGCGVARALFCAMFRRFSPLAYVREVHLGYVPGIYFKELEMGETHIEGA